MKNYNKLAKILEKCFFVSGIGNFDLTTKETVQLLKILDNDNPSEKLKELYDKLSHDRLG
jgi:hypothetical protein